MNKLSIYIGAFRPRTLTASIGPVILGGSLAYATLGSIDVTLFFLVLFVAVLLQINANLVNDYYDHVHQVDTPDRLGPARATATGSLTSKQIQTTYQILFAVALSLGGYLAYRGGIPILLIGGCSALFAYLYTAGPYPLSHMGLGELLAFLFFGPVATWGTYFLLAQEIAALPALIGCGPGFIAAGLMGVNNMRDQISDKKSGKKTLAVRYGERASRLLPIVFIGLSVLIAVITMAQERHAYFLLASVCFLLFVQDWKRILIDPIDKNQNKSLATVGKYLFVYCLLMSIGYLL